MTTPRDAIIGLIASIAGWGIGWVSRSVAPLPVADPEAKFCRDCRWAKPRSMGFLPSYQWAVCMHPSSVQNAGAVLVTGEYRPADMWQCSTVRSDRYISTLNDKLCGPQGRYWEPKWKRP